MITRNQRGRARREAATAVIEATAEVIEADVPNVTIDMLQTAVLASSNTNISAQSYTGDKWNGSFGDTVDYSLDYYTLRDRSRQMFTSNLYARGIIGRLITNVINTGLHLESEPEESILGFDEDSLADWSDRVETQFKLWGLGRESDFRGRKNFGRQQADIYRQALVEGDVLVIARVRRDRPLRIEVISGALVQNPLAADIDTLADGNYVEYGVEYDSQDREVAYWVAQEDGSYKRVPATSTRTGRRVSQLVRGFDSLTDRKRGEPLISILLQSIRDLDRYRDATIRKALLNAIITVFIKKGENKMGTKPLTGGATRRGSEIVVDADGTEREHSIMSQVPGLALETLQQGEEPTVHSTAGTDNKAGEFESAIVHAMAWCMEIPPEIVELSFNSNYSASQAATNEFKMFLNRVRFGLSDEFLNFIWEEWLLVESLDGRLDRGQEILIAWRERRRNYNFRAWVMADWAGAIKPSTDILKTAKGYEALIAQGGITRTRSAAEQTGTKFDKNVKKLKRENLALAAALEPLMPKEEDSAAATQAMATAVVESVMEVLEERFAEMGS